MKVFHLPRAKSGRRDREAGSYTLSAVFAIPIALFFTLGVVNVTRYVTASGTVQQAAREVAKCIVPTDGACVEMRREAAAEALAWYSGDPGVTTRQEVQRFNYSAAVFRQDWSVEAPAFSYLAATPPDVAFTGYAYPLTGYYSHRDRSVLQAPAEWRVFTSVLTPKNSKVFPAWDEWTAQQERESQDRGFARWVPGGEDPNAIVCSLEHPELKRCDPRCAANPGEEICGNAHRFNSRLDFQRIDLLDRRVSAGGSTTFSTGAISVPALPLPGIPCSSPGACGAGVLAGDPLAAQQPEGWRNAAYVAVKVFSFVRPLENRPGAVAWARGNGEAGLEIIVHGGEQTNRICLGGRAKSDVLEKQGSWYDLWMRGPANANGGDKDNAVCPGGKNVHGNIKVPRGGSFEIRASLSAYDGPVEADVYVFYYFDDYEVRQQELSYSCGSQPVADSAANCPEPERCGVPPELLSASRRCVTGASRQGSACRLGPPAVGADDVKEIAFLPCAGAPLPQKSPGYCDWKKGEETTLYTSAPVSSCRTGAARHTFPCGAKGELLPVSCAGVPPEPQLCPSIRALEESKRTQIAKRIYPPVNGTPLDLNKANLSWAGAWSASQTATAFSLPPGADAACAQQTTARGRLITPALVRTDGRVPVVNEFLFDGIPGAPAAEPLKFISEGEPVADPIRTVYPFSNTPEFEIPQLLPSNDPRVVHCGDESSKSASLADRLRAYASRAVPEVADPAVRLDTNAELFDVAAVKESSTCSSSTRSQRLRLPPCTPVRQSSEQVWCDRSEFLGVYPSSLYPEGPPQCWGTRKCYSRPASADEQGGEARPAVNTAKAAQVGLDYMKQTFPLAAPECSGEAGCTTVDASVSPEGIATVAVGYEVPLMWPLNVVLGRSSMAITHTVRTPTELASLDPQVKYEEP